MTQSFGDTIGDTIVVTQPKRCVGDTTLVTHRCVSQTKINSHKKTTSEPHTHVMSNENKFPLKNVCFTPTGRVHFLRFVRHLKWKSIFRKTLRAYVVHELHDSLLCRFVRCFFSPGAPQKAKRTRISARKHPYPRGRFFELLFKIRGRAAPERCCALLRRKRTKARGARMKGAPRRPILTNNPTT